MKAKTRKRIEKRKELPDTIIVYVCDYAGGEPIFAATTDMEEVPVGQTFREYSGGPTGRIVTQVVMDNY